MGCHREAKATSLNVLYLLLLNHSAPWLITVHLSNQVWCAIGQCGFEAYCCFRTNESESCILAFKIMCRQLCSKSRKCQWMNNFMTVTVKAQSFKYYLYLTVKSLTCLESGMPARSYNIQTVVLLRSHCPFRLCLHIVTDLNVSKGCHRWKRGYWTFRAFHCGTSLILANVGPVLNRNVVDFRSKWMCNILTFTTLINLLSHH